MSNVLSMLVEELNLGRLRIVDLTQPLSPQTPLLPLPSQWNNTPAFKIWELSRYDDRGPAWYWNGFETGEHTGTHFDAPVHWVSGKDLADNTVDRIPPKKFVGPACVIDISAEVAKNPDCLLTPDHIRQWEQQHGRIPPGAWVLLRTDWSKKNGSEGLHQRKREWSTYPRIRERNLRVPRQRARRSGRWSGDRRNRCRPSRHFRSTFPQPLSDAWQWKVWFGQPLQS